MTRGRHGLKVLGLAVLAALGLMAFSAAAAQGSFLILGTTLEELKLEKEALKINEKEAHLDGSFWAELTGQFKGCKWGAI